MLYLASSLERWGIEADILDASVGGNKDTLDKTFYRRIRQENGLIRIGMGFDEIAEYVGRGHYDFVGINSNFTCQTRMVFETARAIKENLGIKIYTGGVNARALKGRFLRTGYFDGICLTDGELIFPRMVLAKSLQNVAGIAFNDGVNPVDSSCFPETLDDLPMPAWKKLPLEKYEQIASPHGVDVTEKKNRKYAPIMASRGCIFSCDYCHVSTEKKDIGKLRCHSINRVLQEIDVLKSLGIEKLFFEDDCLFAYKERIKAIFRLIEGVTISDTNGINIIHLYKNGEVDLEFIEILKKAGFAQMVFPVESASLRILKKYASNKVPQGVDLVSLMKTLNCIGIKAPVNMMIGFPDETEQEMNQSIELARRLVDAGAPYATFFIPIPFAGSKLCEMAIREGYLDVDFDTDLMNWKRPIMKNTVVSPERLVEIRDRANESVNTKNHLETRVKQSAGYRLAI